MISTGRLIRALEIERARLRTPKELDTEFVRGIRQGILLSIAMTREVWKATKYHRVSNPRGNFNSPKKSVLSKPTGMKKFSLLKSKEI
jgi:hypothetical protein